MSEFNTEKAMVALGVAAGKALRSQRYTLCDVARQVRRVADGYGSANARRLLETLHDTSRAPALVGAYAAALEAGTSAPSPNREGT